MKNDVVLGESLKTDYFWKAYEEDTFNFLTETRSILINKIIDEDLIETAVLQIFRWNAEDDAKEVYKDFNREEFPITIYINTDGGLLNETLSLVSAIETSKTPIITFGLGKIQSGGFLILMSGHNRYIQRYSQVMYHQLSAGVFGKANDMNERIDEIKKRQKIMDGLVLSKTKIPPEKLKEANDKKTDLYFSPDECLKYGVVDFIYGQDYIKILEEAKKLVEEEATKEVNKNKTKMTKRRKV